MTWIIDDTGRRWVRMPPRLRRKPARALRFANIAVGDQLLLKPRGDWYRKLPWYYIVTDMWFDPVAGQSDLLKGELIGIQRIADNGEPGGRKESHTKRGLASQGFFPAEIDFIAQCKAKLAAEGGVVVDIREGRTLQRSPKMPGGRL